MLPIFLLLLVVSCSKRLEAKDCRISIKQLSYKDEPLILDNSAPLFLLPNVGSDVVLKPGNTLRVACPGARNAILVNKRPLSSTIATARCTNSGAFQITPRPAVAFSQITCRRPAVATRINVPAPCSPNYAGFQIGFQIGPALVQIASGCFNSAAKSSSYVAHKIPSQIGFSAVNVPRPSWSDERLGIDKLYPNQQSIINGQLGLPPTDTTYIKTNPSKFRLSRGHFAPKADYVYGPQQRATFFITNSAPQWQACNAGNWGSLEQSIRNLAINRKKAFDIYTGTHGVMTLKHSKSGVQTPLYLIPATKQVIIPKFFWKVVRDPATGQAAAFITFNNPYAAVTPGDIPCTNVCPRVTYLKIRNLTDQVSGYTVCCEVDVFRRVVSAIPPFVTRGLLV